MRVSGFLGGYVWDGLLQEMFQDCSVCLLKDALLRYIENKLEAPLNVILD